MSICWPMLRRAALLAALAMLATAAWGQVTPGGKPARPPRAPKLPEAAAEAPKLAEEKSGAVATREGLRLRLVTDVGNVHITTQEASEVRYKVRIETDSREPDAQSLLTQYAFSARTSSSGVQLTGQAPAHNFRGRFWVNYDVSVPLRYSLDVVTQAGNINALDIDGRVSLVTNGGNITAGRVGGKEAAGARLETQGGHISVLDVDGELRAITAGGHINAANVQGDAVLRSGGGHIRAGTIQGSAQLETGGGNISVQGAGSRVVATTGGGQIDFGEAAGSIQARTGGGGIRVLRVAGPMRLETSGGSICLTKVQGAVRASTAAGTITAWFMPDGKLSGASQLESGQGDILVYLPRELPVTIDATIEMGADHRIIADPSLALKVSYDDSGSGGHTIRGVLNGGGELLRLKTVAGNIQLKLSDTDSQIRLNQPQMEDIRRRLELQRQRLVERQRQREQELEAQLEWQVGQAREQQRQVQEEHERGAEREAGRLEEWQRKLEHIWWGGLRVNSEAQQKKLLHSVRPVYPDVAKQAGIEGTVRLRVMISKDGTVREVKVLAGEPVLASAASDAVRQWRYQPTRLDGKPLNVVTTVTVDFRLR